MLPRFGFRPLVRAGLLLAAVSCAALAAVLRPGVGVLLPGAICAAYGVGLGFANTALLIAVQSSVPWERRGVATASTIFFRVIGGTVAVGVLGGVLAATLEGSGVPSSVADKLLGPEGAKLDPALVAGASSALARGMDRVFIAIAALSACAFAASLAFPKMRMKERRAAA